MSSYPSRRRFLGTALAASAAPFLLPSGLRANPGGPGQRVGMGFIGMGKQMQGLLRGCLSRRKDVQVLAVCDVDTTRREAAKKSVEEFYAQEKPEGWTGCAAYNDFRELLARSDIDAVVIATPDHWHAIIAVAAAKAGKDIYCEKPLTQTVTEAVALMAAIKAHGRILQTGSMQRSMREFRVAAELVRNGVIGKLTAIDASFGPPGKWCDLPEEAVEPGLDWNLWLGPAPERPYHSELAPRGIHKHYPNWRDYREYGGGMVTDWGAHHLDIAQWALGVDETGGPLEVVPPEKSGAPNGGKLVYADGLTLTHRGTENGLGVVFHGQDGVVRVQRGKFEFSLGGKTVAKFWNPEDGSALPVELAKAEKGYLRDAKVKLYNSRDHTQDFLDAMRSRKPPVATVDIGARTVIACHLLNFGYYYGKKFQWDPAACTFAGGSGDKEWLHRAYRGDWQIT